MVSGRRSPTEIPAASLAGIDIAAVRAGDPTAADEIERLGHAMNAGTDSDADFLRLCQLLVLVGEVGIAERLLLANADETAEAGRFFRETFPARVGAFDVATDAFKAQHGVSWKQLSAPRVLQRVFRITASTGTVEGPVAEMLRRNGCEVVISDRKGGIAADVQVPGYLHAIPMVYRDGAWMIDLEHVGAGWLVNIGRQPR